MLLRMNLKACSFTFHYSYRATGTIFICWRFQSRGCCKSIFSHFTPSLLVFLHSFNFSTNFLVASNKHNNSRVVKTLLVTLPGINKPGKEVCCPSVCPKRVVLMIAATCSNYLCPDTLACVHFPHHCPCPHADVEDKVELGEGVAICASKGGWKEGETLRKIELARKGLL